MTAFKENALGVIHISRSCRQDAMRPSGCSPVRSWTIVSSHAERLSPLDCTL